MMPLLRLKTTECRVGIVGQYNAGKTVLLTSLINHLQDHDPERFALGSPNTRIRKFEKLPCDAGWAEFPFAKHRDSLVHAGSWPEKTSDRYQYTCQFERSDWSFSDVVLKLFDLPGERVADAAMLGRNYADWSDHTLHHLQSDTPYREQCLPFLQAILQPNATEIELVDSYKLALANLILSYKPLISPSTFLLDKTGNKARPADAATLANSRICGLDASRQFTPLPPALRETPTGKLFAVHYDEYRTEIVEHFLSALRSCHALIVMLDIPMLLAGGVGMYDDNRQMVRDLFHVLEPGESLLGTSVRHLSKLFLPREMRPSWITRVAFVAPKLDLIHPGDRDRALHLLRRMVGKVAADRDGVSHEFFPCSAVVSTKPDEKSLIGVPLRDASGKKIAPGPEQRFTPSTVPTDWPRSWEPGEYAFPEVYPIVPRRKDCPPEQINLDRVLTFVLG